MSIHNRSHLKSELRFNAYYFIYGMKVSVFIEKLRRDVGIVTNTSASEGMEPDYTLHYPQPAPWLLQQ